MKRVITAALALVLCLVLLTGCDGFFKTDEELIEDRIYTFANAYNSGDIDAVADCFDSKTKTTIKSALGIGDSLISGLTGFGISLSDLFGLGMGLTAGDVMTVQQVDSIQINGDSATAVVTLVLSDEWSGSGDVETGQCVFKLKSEGMDWYICDMTDY